jgi:cytosine/adenosine deaminase-related metal-dependent hydrolase
VVVTTPPDIVVRDAYLQDRDDVYDISIADGEITGIEETVDTAADTELAAGGNLVSPGFVDAHVHIDQALSLGDRRCPDHNHDTFEKRWSIDMSAECFETTDAETIEETVVEVAGMAVANGVTHTRTHAYIDETVGPKSARAVQAAREQVADALDMEIVAFPQQGLLAEPGAGPQLLRDAVDAGADLVGGLDPATINGDISEWLDTVFGVAEEMDVGIDLHLHDAGSLGVYTLDRLVDVTEAYGYDGRVTASHCYALADVADRDGAPSMPVDSLADLLARFADVDLSVVTSYLTTPQAMPVRELQEAGIALGQGSDQVQDFWLAPGNTDPVEEALIQSLGLGGDFEYATNPGLDRVWRMLTTGGASVLGIDDGTAADLLVHDNRSRQRVIMDQSKPRGVIKDGTVVARDGTLVDG